MVLKPMFLTLYSQSNVNVISQYDAVGIDCCKDEESGGIVYLASGGCVVAECLACEKLWRFLNLPTHGVGPIVSATDNPSQFDWPSTQT